MTAAAALVSVSVTALPLMGGEKKKDPNEIGARDVSKGLNFYSLEQEMALGRQLAAEVARQAHLVDDPIISEYINRLGQNLARNSDVTFPVRFALVEADEINAFTLPGGFIYVNTGTFRLSDNEAELASVMAHELGHAAARHATRQMTRGDLANLAQIPLMLAGGWAGLGARQAANAAMPMAFFKFSRNFESEADMLGLQYLWKTGYDPTAALDMFERIESTERRQPGAVSKLFRSHPLTPDRIAKTQKNIEEMLPGRKEYVLTTSEYEDVRERLADLGQAAKAAPAKTDAPVLRRAPSATIDPGRPTGADGEERPTVRRR
jgi:beta-barrel assembly-enhancing protease